MRQGANPNQTVSREKEMMWEEEEVEEEREKERKKKKDTENGRERGRKAFLGG